MTCGLSGNALVPSEPLYTELVCRRRQSPPFPHLARAESPYVVLSFPGVRAKHETAELFLQASLQSKVVSVMKEKCSETREGGSANGAAKERPFDLVWHPLVPPHSVEHSPSAICSPNSLIDFSAHREHGRIHDAQRAVGSLYLVLLLFSRELSIFNRPSEVGQDHQFSSILSQTVSSAEFTSPILFATVCSHSFAVPNSSKLFSKTSSANSVTPHERSTFWYGLRPKIPPFLLVTDVCYVSIAPWKTAPNSSGAFLSPMNKPTCARPFVIRSGANTSVKSRRQRTEGVCHVQTFVNK